jgi:zinc transport system ATP-binding protein
MEPIVYVESLNFGYGSHVVLCDFNINIFPGEFVALTGRNGTGKSTFLNLLLRRIRPDSGRILFFGVPLETFDRWEWVGYVSQVHAGATPEFPVTVEEILSLNQYRGFCRGNAEKQDPAAIRSNPAKQ